MRTDNMMMELLSYADEYKSFISGPNNFRKEINPEYKANRKDVIKPQWLNDCKQYLNDEYKSEVTDGFEADDALGFNQTEESVIMSIDKDLLMIPGHHYNFVKKEYHEVSELDGLKAFYRQMLIGDSADNIFGVKGIGKVKAAKLIDPLTTEQELWDVVFDLYDDGTFNPRLWMNADCLWIMRKEGERFSNRYENIQKKS
jgi:5'-3' exonuclease